jgi:hypothetical protein
MALIRRQFSISYDVIGVGAFTPDNETNDFIVSHVK